MDSVAFFRFVLPINKRLLWVQKYDPLRHRSAGLSIRLDLPMLILPFPSPVSPLLFISSSYDPLGNSASVGFLSVLSLVIFDYVSQFSSRLSTVVYLKWAYFEFGKYGKPHYSLNPVYAFGKTDLNF